MLDAVTNGAVYLQKPAKVIGDRIENFLAMNERPKRAIFSGLLIFGVHGSGKTRLAKVICKSKGIPTTYIEGSKNMPLGNGEAERWLLNLFSQNNSSEPSFLIIDEIDQLIDSGGPLITSLLLNIFERQTDPSFTPIFLIGI